MHLARGARGHQLRRRERQRAAGARGTHAPVGVAAEKVLPRPDLDGRVAREVGGPLWVRDVAAKHRRQQLRCEARRAVRAAEVAAVAAPKAQQLPRDHAAAEQQAARAVRAQQRFGRRAGERGVRAPRGRGLVRPQQRVERVAPRAHRLAPAPKVRGHVAKLVERERHARLVPALAQQRDGLRACARRLFACAPYAGGGARLA